MSTQRINIGSMYSEHAVPPGAQVRELKTCEICGRSFARKFAATEIYATYMACFTVMLSKPPLEVTATLRKDRGERFCGACKSRQLMPDVEAQIKYLIQLPGTTQQMKHAPREPKYDRSLLPREGRHDGPRPRRNYCPPLLSPAELRVAELVATRHQGYIRLSTELGLGTNYFKHVAGEVYRKLNVRGREQLMSLWAQELFRAGVLALSEGGADRADRSDVAPGRHSSGAHAAGIGRGLHADPCPGRARAAEGARPADRAARAEHREAGPLGAV